MNTRARAAGPLFLLLALASCASGPSLPSDAEPERLLPAGALAYAKLDRELFRAAAAALGGPDAARSAKALVDRTDTVWVAVSAQSSGDPGLLAVARGRYPSAGSLALALRSGWHRDGLSWAQDSGPFRVASAGTKALAFGTVALDGVLSAITMPGPHPIPDDWRAAWDADVAVFVPRPLASLAGSLGMDPDAAPLEAAMVAARQDGDAYRAELVFGFADERSARIFAPLCRLILYGAAHSLWSPRANDILSAAEWTAAGQRVTAHGFSLDAAELAAFLTALQ
ncbi:MAG: hypothetical protein KBB32_08125 [Spirochaetia bacterium]|nr:hypothetical protein [Spirochaetia bacterium]